MKHCENRAGDIYSSCTTSHLIQNQCYAHFCQLAKLVKSLKRMISKSTCFSLTCQNLEYFVIVPLIFPIFALPIFLVLLNLLTEPLQKKKKKTKKKLKKFASLQFASICRQAAVMQAATAVQTLLMAIHTILWCFGLAADWHKHMAVAMVSAKCSLDNGKCTKMHFPGILKPHNFFIKLWTKYSTGEATESVQLYV